jgi:hypothetical protein
MSDRGRRYAPLVAALACLAGLGVFAPTPALANTPWWHVSTNIWPANIAPGGEGTVAVRVLNVGDQTSSGQITLGDLLPEHLKIQHVGFFVLPSKVAHDDVGPALCTVTGQQVSCRTEPPTEAFFEEHFQKRFKELEELLGEPLSQETREAIEGFERPSLEAEFDIEPLRPFENIEMQITVKDEGATPGALNKAEVKGGGAPSVTQRHAIPISSSPSSFGAEGFSMVPEEEGGGVDVQAASHPYQLTSEFSLNQTADLEHPPALPRNLRFNLPAGLIGNATLLPKCSDLDFKHVFKGEENLCPAETVVGVASVTVFEPQNLKFGTFPVPLFNLVPAAGEPARFGFEIAQAPVTLDASVRTGSDYGVSVSVSNITQLTNFISSAVTFWGVPGDKSHDSARGWSCLVGGHWTENAGRGLPCVGSSDSHPAPFLTMPSSCKLPFLASVEGVSWTAPPVKPEASTLAPRTYSLSDEFGRGLGISGCNQLPFAPTIENQPDVTAASTPTGLATTVNVPQEVSLGANGLASSSVRDISVKFPEGVTVNPASADGLEACSEEQVGFTGPGELDPSGEPGVQTALFTPTIGTPFCPTASKIGTVKIKIPVIENPLEGSLYLARQDANPFHTLLASYIVAEDHESGVLVKLPGKITLDKDTGQLTATFENSPDAPLESAEIHLFGGDRAPLSTPTQCRDNTPAHPGLYTTRATFTPWSGSAPVVSNSDFKITTGVNGGPCPGASLPFTPTLAAGSPNVSAGAFSPLTTTISRQDGDQNINRVQLHLAPGMSGILAGVPLCKEAQANEGTCPEASLIGHTIVSVGLGGDPFSVTGGRVYLTEKYEGAAFGLSIVNPAKAGPFDLEQGTPCDCVVVRAKIEVDPRTAALTVTTGEIPHILKGIPLQIKHVNVTIDRQGFTFNPTNCNPLSITGTIGAVEGATSPVSDPFQVTNCAALKFTPTVAVATAGKASKANGASLHFKIAYPKGAMGAQSWFNEAKFDIPKQLPARLTTIQKACLAATFETNRGACPSASKIGTAIVKTPVLPVPLTGPVYFVSYGGAKFPDAVVVLDGYGVHIELHGETFIDGKTGVTSATFRNTPDVPFESIEVNIPTGPFSEFGANLPAKAHGSFCGQKLVMPTFFKAQNGLEIHQNTKVGVTGCAKKKALTRKQKLAKAMKACHSKHGGKRAACEKQARKKYGPVKKKKK